MGADGLAAELRFRPQRAARPRHLGNYPNPSGLAEHCEWRPLALRECNDRAPTSGTACFKPISGSCLGRRRREVPWRQASLPDVEPGFPARRKRPHAICSAYSIRAENPDVHSAAPFRGVAALSLPRPAPLFRLFLELGWLLEVRLARVRLSLLSQMRLRLPFPVQWVAELPKRCAPAPLRQLPSRAGGASSDWRARTKSPPLPPGTQPVQCGQIHRRFPQVPATRTWAVPGRCRCAWRAKCHGH